MIIQPWPPDGTIVGTTPALPDTTRRRRAPLDAAQLADELRTVATCVLGFTELLRDAGLPDVDRQVYLGILHDEATRLARIVEVLDDAAATSSDGVPKLPD